MRFSISLLLGALFISLTLKLGANIAQFRFEHIDLPNSLESKIVYDIIEDGEGYIWIGLKSGLVRYNGHQSVKIGLIIDGEEPREFGPIMDLEEDHLGNIWIGTQKGLFIYDKKTELSTEFKTDAILVMNVRSLLKGRSTEMIIGANNGLFIYNQQTNKTVRYVHHAGIEKGLSHNTIRSLYEDTKGIIWLGTRDKLNRFDREKQEFLPLTMRKSTDFGVRNNLVLTIEPMDEKADSILLVGTETGLCFLNTNTLEFTEYNKENTNQTLSNSVIKTVCKVNNDEIWLGTDYGLNHLHLPQMTFSSLEHDYFNSFSISNNVIWDICKDSNGNIWIGTDNGVDKLYIKDTGFEFNKIAKHLSVMKAGVSVNSFLVDRRGDYWIATDEGVARYFLTDDRFEYVAPPTLLHRKANDICEDKNGYIWITSPAGLNIYDPYQNEYSRYYAGKKDVTVLNTNYLGALCPDSSGNVWIGSIADGIFKATRNKDGQITFVNFKHDEEDVNSISGNLISDLVYDHDGNLWIGTPNGLDRLDPVSGQFERLSARSSSNIPNNFINQMCYEYNKQLIISAANGMFIWDFKRKTFEQVENVPRNLQSFIFENDFLWLTTFNDLFRLDLKTGNKQKIPNIVTGLKEYNKGVYKNKSGRMFMGGFEGFISFDPDRILLDTVAPDIHFTDLQIMNNSIRPYEKFNDRFIIKQSIDQTENIKLRYSENSFRIEFSSLSMTDKNSSMYTCYLQNYDDEWKQLDGGINYVNYTKVRPGKYTFYVAPSLDYLDTLENVRKLEIRILPPIWASVWAFLIYLFLIFMVTFSLRRVVVARMRLLNDIQLAKLQKQKSEELVEIKSRFFSNISHELKTPLTLISSPLDKLISTEQDARKIKTFVIMKRNTDRLIRLVNQVLDVRKIDKGIEKLHIQKYDLVRFCNRIVGQFEEEAINRHIDLRVKSKVDSMLMWFDMEKMEKVLFNLLSNAFKFTPDEGKIKLIIDQQIIDSSSTTEQLIRIRLKDSGDGIAPEMIDGIFDRFTNVQNSQYSSQEGTGIGLSLVKDYVNMHSGKVEVESLLGEGTVFTLYLPLKKEGLVDYVEAEVDDKTSMVDNDQDDPVLEGDLEPSDSHKPKVLVVEDDADMRYFLKDSLDQDYNVILGVDGMEGYKEAIKQIPDLIISDIMMPKLTGIELCEKLKSDVRTSHIPFIMLTAKGNVETRMQGIELGADDFIQKPFSMEYLLLRTRKLIEQRNELKNTLKKQTTIEPSEVTVTSLDEKFLKELVEKIEEQMDNSELNVKMLSEMVGISHINLYRKIKGLTGLTAAEFIRTIRLKRAGQLLKTGEYNVKDVMYMVGFTHRSYFSQSFKDLFGVSPKEYK